jgi:putative transcriptional regulator
MTVTHHPDDALLLSYAAGVANEGQSLVVATHLTFCPRCRAVVADAEIAGGALLAAAEPQALRGNALNEALSKLDSEPVALPSPPDVKSSLPRPLQSYIGNKLQDVRWNKIGFGLSHKPLFRCGKSNVQLIRSQSGRGVGAHTHKGEELTLVLAGGFTDVTGHYVRGDVQTAASDVVHAPLADEGDDCIVLAVTNAPLRFANLGVSLLGKFFGF